MHIREVLLATVVAVSPASFSTSAQTETLPAGGVPESAPGQPQEPVGEAPPEPQEIPQVVVSDRGVRGVLTPPGVTVVEPSVIYANSSSTLVAIEGFSIVPALVIGLINVNQLQRDTVWAGVAVRRGFGSAFEAELSVPYVWRNEDSRQREILDSSSADIINESDGNGIGDVEAALRYQINTGHGGGPIYITSLRVKSTTGDGPFDVERVTFNTEDGERVGDILLEQPTGSGFWGIQPSVTAIYSTAPAVLYGSLSYYWNLEDNVDHFGKVDPGDAVGVSGGIGFAVNEGTSFSLGYEHNTVFKTDVENDNGVESSFDTIQIGSVLLGVSQRLTASTTLNVSVAIGATDEASDVQVSVRLPITF